MPLPCGTGAEPQKAPSYRARLRSSHGPPIAFLNTRWGRDEMAGKHTAPARPLRHKPSTIPLRSWTESCSDSRPKRNRPRQTAEPRVSFTRDEEMAYVVELRRPRPAIHVDVCAGKKHARRTPSPPARTIKRKRGFTDGRSLAKEGQQHGVHVHHKSPATTSGSVPGLSPSRSSGTTPISSVKTPSPSGVAPARTALGPRSGSWRNSERRKAVYYETEYRYPRPVHQQRPSNVLNAGLHPIDTGAGLSKQKRREGVALADSNAHAYGHWLEQEKVSEVKSRSGRVSLGLSKLLRGGSGTKEEMNKRVRRRGKGFGVFEWSPFS